jgi:hypothetical protein
MPTSQSAIRPRNRAVGREVEHPKDNQPQPHVRGDRQPSGVPRQPVQPPIVLARLPEVVEPPNAKPLTLKLSWVLNFRWQDGLRRLVQMDPNYLAGGVLALVVFVLVMITMRNRDGASAAVTVSNDAIAAAPPAQAMPVAESTAQPLQQQRDSTPIQESQQLAQAPTHTNWPQTARDAAATYAAEPAPAQHPLSGIYYPRTPYDAPAGVSFEHVAGKPVAAFAAVNAGGPAEGVRTAMRNANGQREPQPSQTEPVARLDGIITRSR